uniref:Uncharacterized protein n=1 Tax=Anguilla anguilla TaxID=7936 RepID=A0A0E9ULC0_ANGAN
MENRSLASPQKDVPNMTSRKLRFSIPRP